MGLREVVVGAAGALALAFPAHAASDWSAVGKALGKAGAVQAGGVYRVGFPRSRRIDFRLPLGHVPQRICPARLLAEGFRDRACHLEGLLSSCDIACFGLPALHIALNAR